MKAEAVVERVARQLKALIDSSLEDGDHLHGERWSRGSGNGIVVFCLARPVADPCNVKQL